MNATVKRKFNALIQGIGARPSSSSSPENNASPPDATDNDASAASSDVSTMVNDLHFLAKKRRIGHPSSIPPTTHAGIPTTNGAQPVKGATTISNVVLRKWTPTNVAAKDTQPKYSPADREQLLKRLASFQELTDWAPKPERVGEIEWAKRGWVCQGKERVRCTLCSRELVVGVNRKTVDGKEVPVLVASEIEEALVEKYAELIVASHQEDCLWRKRGCDDSLLRLPLAQAKTVLESLRQRYDDLCNRKDFLPYEFNLRLPEGFDIDAILSYLPPDFFTVPPPSQNKAAPNGGTAAPSTLPPKPNRSALALAAMGWQGLSNPRIGPVPNSASCHSCLRRLGLWMFKSKEVDPETNTILVPAPMDHLDPLREHRFFCPWKNGGVQRNPGAKPASGREGEKAGWEVLVQVLKNDAYLRNRAGRTDALHFRSKSAVTPQAAHSTIVTTPDRPTTAGPGVQPGEDTPIPTLGFTLVDDEEDEETRSAKDKERWARLRKVKSLFNTKVGGKLKKSASRPGTGHSTLGA